MSDAVDRINTMGFRLPENPELDLSLPFDLSVVTSNILINDMSIANSLRAYAESQLALAKIDVKRKEQEYKKAYAAKYLGLRGEKLIEKERTCKLDIDEDLILIKENEMKSEELSILLQTVWNRFESIYHLLSREISRRGLYKQALE